MKNFYFEILRHNCDVALYDYQSITSKLQNMTSVQEMVKFKDAKIIIFSKNILKFFFVLLDYIIQFSILTKNLVNF